MPSKPELTKEKQTHHNAVTISITVIMMRILSTHPPTLSSADYTKHCTLGKFQWTWQTIAWLLAIFSAFPEYRDVCGLSLKGPNWLVYNSQRDKPLSTSIHIPLGNLYNRSSRFSPDQRMLGLWQSQPWSTLLWAWLSQSSIHHSFIVTRKIQGHKLRLMMLIYWPWIICPSYMPEKLPSGVCRSLASSDQKNETISRNLLLC